MTQTFKTPFNFALLWSTLVLIGAIIGFFLGRFIVRNFDNRHYALSVLVIAFMVSLFIGVGQWLALMIRLRNVWWWIPATLIGYSVGSFVFFFIIAILGQAFFRSDQLYMRLYPWIQFALPLMLTGIFTGALQWFALGRRLSTSLKWLLVSGFGLVIGLLPVVFLANEYAAKKVGSLTLFGIIGIILFALFTGGFAGPVIVNSETNND
jgi:hypothetical protein